MLFYLKSHFKEEHQYATSSFPFFLKKARPKKQKEIININYLITVLIKMQLLIFLVFSQYGLACKYGIIGCKIAFSNTWCNNCQSSKAVTETSIYFTIFNLLFQ